MAVDLVLGGSVLAEAVRQHPVLKLHLDAHNAPPCPSTVAENEGRAEALPFHADGT